VIEQVSTLVASWSAKIGRWITALKNSIGRLVPLIRRLGDIIESLKKLLRDMHGTDGNPLKSATGDGEPTMRPSAAPGAAPMNIDPNIIRFSQHSVTGTPAIADAMRANGWVGDPIDVVQMPDGSLTTVDNTRVLAAKQAGIDVSANVHGFDEPLPANMVGRFTTRTGQATTWGEAISQRISRQTAALRNTSPLGSWNDPTAR
jgi:hypothetical protein